MTPPPPSAELQALLSEREWVHRLARAIASNADLADDAEQDAWVAALRGPPPASVRGWFRSVVRRAVAESARRDHRRRSREAAVAPDEIQPSAADLVARAQAPPAVVDAVVTLARPWRPDL